MTDWSNDLQMALAAGDPKQMQAMLARVPKDILHKAIPYIAQLGKNSIDAGKPEESLIYFDQLIDLEPNDSEWRVERARLHLKLDQLTEALVDTKRVVELRPTESLGYRLQAEAHEGLRERPQAVAAYREVLKLEPNDEKSQQRIKFLETEIHKEALLKQALDPAAAQSIKVEALPLPPITFDPALFNDPSIPASADKTMAEGLKQHLSRYSGLQSLKNTLDRLEDPHWLDAWDAALSAMHGAKIMMHGSELGLFALRARHHGASKIVAIESYPLDARVCSGIVQKNLLTAWHDTNGTAIPSWSEEEQRKSFEEFARHIDILSPDAKELSEEACEYFIYPNIDHSLLGTGIIKTIRHYRERGLLGTAKVLPGKAKVFARGIQWAYPGAHFQLQPMNDLRWSPYPQALELSDDAWIALTDAVQVGEIDFNNFHETTWDTHLPVQRSGDLNAIVFWFELELGATHLSTAPGSDLRCIKPAIQYCDPQALQAGDSLNIHVQVKETRLHFQTQPGNKQERSNSLPSWYLPMLLDRTRNDAYQSALQDVFKSTDIETVLDIGAGCGLLSMMAAQSGAHAIYACESDPAIQKVCAQILKLNNFDNSITLVGKDIRSMTVPTDMMDRADLALFELFDCSLIGEGVLHFLAYAREHLLKENARYLPMSARVHAMVVEYHIDRIWDIDVNLLNPYRFSSSFINVDAKTLQYRALCEPFEIFSFDFSKASPQPEEKELQIPALDAGIAGAILFWFDLQIDEHRWLSNGPNSDAPLHWKQALQFLPEVHITRDTQLPLIAKHDGSHLTFQWKPDALPKESFSKLPRFDPRWWQQTTELETQTRELLQHCTSNPSEYTKVAELAKRFSVDPASHGLDPKIAQRFATMFLSR